MTGILASVLVVSVIGSRTVALAGTALHPFLGSLGVLAGFGEGEEVALAIDKTAADPHLDADATVGGVCLDGSVVDISTQRVQGDTTLFEVLGTGDFGAAQTTGCRDLDAVGVGAHRGGNGGLDGLLVSHTAFDLLGDVLGHQLGVQIRALHLNDVDLDLLAGDDLQFFLHLVNLLALN